MGRSSKSLSIHSRHSSVDEAGSIELEERKPLIDHSIDEVEESKEHHEPLETAHTLMSLSSFNKTISDFSNEWEVDAAAVNAANELLAKFYRTYTTPSQRHPHELESARASRLVELYKYLSTLDDIQAPFITLKNQCDAFIRIFLQIPPEADLNDAIGAWEAKRVFIPTLVGPLPGLTSSSRDLEDHIKLDALLLAEENGTSLSRQEEIRQLMVRITSQNKSGHVTEEQSKKLINMDKEKRYRQYLQPKKILDLFKKGTYGVVGAKYQHQLNEEGWHICDAKQRENYRVYADFNHPQLLQPVVEGEGDDLNLSFTVATTKNKKAFVNHPQKQSDDNEIDPQYFDHAEMFVIDAEGRMYLFSADDHEDGLTPASVMKCEPVLFAGRLISKEAGEFELHSSSKEYKTTQLMSRLAVHYLAKQARILTENTVVYSAPILRTPVAKIVAKNTTPQEIELAKAQRLNIPNYLENRENESYTLFAGPHSFLRPDDIFPTDGTIPDEVYNEDESRQIELIENNKAIKASIAERFNLSSANAIWQVPEEAFEELLQDLENNGDFQISQEQLDNLAEYYHKAKARKKLIATEFFNAELIEKIYNAMFDNDETKAAFENEVRQKHYSNAKLDAIWNLGNKVQFDFFISRLLENNSLLTNQEYQAFIERVKAEGNPQKAARFDRLISRNELPENQPENFEDEEYEAVQEAHELVKSRKNMLTEFYYSRRQISSTPEQNLAHFMYGEIYSDCRKHPWDNNRIGPYLGFIIAGVLLLLILTSVVLFAPQLLALTICCVMHFYAIVLIGYLIGITVGGVLGTAAALIADKLLEPKPVNIAEGKYDYERSRFYQLPDEQEVTRVLEDNSVATKEAESEENSLTAQKSTSEEKNVASKEPDVAEDFVLVEGEGSASYSAG